MDIDDKELMWEEVSTEHLVKDQWIDFRRSRFRFPDGSEYEPFYNMSRRDYSVIIAFDKDKRFVCVKQYRQGIREVTTEFPAGGIEPEEGRCNGRDAGSIELALKTAKRELQEETGYTSSDWVYLTSVASNPGMSDNYGHIFVARDCVKSEEMHLDDTEYLKTLLKTEEEIDRMIEEGRFYQPVHIMAWYMAKAKGII